MSQQDNKFDLWCIVELFGHAKIAGKCTEQNIAGANMLRVDVPATESTQAFTRFLGSSAIYAINPVDEDTCRAFCSKLQVQPISVWDQKEIIKGIRPELPSAARIECDVDYGDDDDDTF